MEDIIITNGCTEALNLSLKAATKPGDTIIIESPTDPWLRQTIKDSGIYTLEIPSSPETGIDLKSMKQILNSHTISACMVNPNFQNPLGFVMPDTCKKELLSMLSERNIPIIENDISGELYFEGHRPNPIKKWDSAGNVMYCSSFSKTLAAGLRIGWVIPGRYKEKIRRMKLNRSMISPSLNQIVLANYLKDGGFPRHLRQLRHTLKLQHSYCAASILRHFPETIKLTSPKGGLSIWIELPKGINSNEVYYEARTRNISIMPGHLCSGHSDYHNFIRIGYGGFWNNKLDQAIRKIGDIIKKMIILCHYFRSQGLPGNAYSEALVIFLIC